MKDPIVEKIRKNRDAHAKRFNYNLSEICEDLKKHQLQYKDRWAKRKPKEIKNAAKENA